MANHVISMLHTREPRQTKRNQRAASQGPVSLYFPYEFDDGNHHLTTQCLALMTRTDSVVRIRECRHDMPPTKYVYDFHTSQTIIIQISLSLSHSCPALIHSIKTHWLQVQHD